MNLPQQPSEIALLPTRGSQSSYSSVENLLPIVMKNINFAYPLRSDVPILQNLTLRFSASQFTALVGSSGSGKSTIAAILLALYAASSSNTNSFIASESSLATPLTSGGVPSSKLNVPALRSHMALVPQFPSTEYLPCYCYGEYYIWYPCLVAFAHAGQHRSCGHVSRNS